MENKYPLDGASVKILKALQQDARLSVQDLSGRIGLSSTPTWKRVKEMEKAGVIDHYTAVLNRARVGLKNCVLAEVNLARHVENVVEEFEKAVQEHDAIIECYATTGQADYMLKVVTPDIGEYDAFLHNVIFKLPGVSEIRSSVVLREIKPPSPLPLDHL
ncbi:Lrp/AsnC family transcriptional regulator [Mangrovitalea sediminis]|uniref:Lrp/AsnC family transcriptional regulator n=1 Tax=Mangrovitalea sediminis TaxID=1982043 RepID=UPI000BE605B4|nr:Lrp/AsnC family transcriptional regulator [Mangrovitalea sediminis]